MSSRRHLIINPSNAATTYGYSAAQNTMRFDIGNQGMMVAKDIRLEFDVDFFKADNTTPAMTDNYQIDPYIAAHSLIQTISWSSRNFNESQMERINNYPTLAKLIVSSLHSKNDMDNQLFNEQKSVGFGITNNDGKLPGIAADTLTARRNVCKTMKVSMRLLCGVCLSEPIDLDVTQGATLDLTLNNNSAALFGADAVNGYYQISNPKLHVPIIMEEDAVIMAKRSQPSQTLRFLSYSSIFDTLDTNGVTSLNHRLGLRNTLSCMAAFCPTKFLNTYSQNSIGLYNPGLASIVFRKNSQQFPLYYTLEIDRNTGLQVNQPSTLPQVAWNYLSAHRETADIKHSSFNPDNVRGAVERQGFSPFAAGVSYDEVSGNGVNSQIDNLSVTINANLADPTDTAADPSTPYGAFFYYLNINNIVVNQNMGVVNMS